MKKSLGFTLAEVLITLAIIGVVAAMTIPSVIVNTNQAEYRTGLRKAVASLNQSITMNIALEGESPADNSNLFDYLQQHMSILSSYKYDTSDASRPKFTANSLFYTADGIRFEFPTGELDVTIHETNASVKFNENMDGNVSPKNCGSAGVAGGASGTTTLSPCLIVVDVNGDKKPTPKDVGTAETYTFAQPGERLIKDIFPIMITDQKAVPFGQVAQRAMYQANN